MHSKVFYGLFTIEVIETIFRPPRMSASSPEKAAVFFIYIYFKVFLAFTRRFTSVVKIVGRH